MARFDLTNRHIALLIIVAMLGFSALSFFGYGTLEPTLARNFLVLAGGLLTSETARRAIQTQRHEDYSFSQGKPRHRTKREETDESENK